MKLEESILKIILEKVAKKAVEEQLDEEQINNLVDAAIKATLTDGVQDASDSVADHLEKQIPEMVTQERRMQKAFERRLHARWKKALDLYDATVILTKESGEAYVQQHAEQAGKDKDAIFTVLTRLHVRACQTASAVGVLLKSGYARDALARQRTLHELAATAFFIKEHGQETAERYWLHNAIESYKAALQYQEHCKRLGYEPYTEAEMNAFLTKKDELIARFGKVFNEQYGWAAKALDKDRGIQIADIDSAVKLDHLRPYYRMASHGVHANPKGMLFDIGNVYKDGPDHQSILLAGASDAGLADPGQLALISLGQCTAALLTLKSDLEAVIKLKILQRFTHEACDAFIATHRNLEPEEEEHIEAFQP